MITESFEVYNEHGAIYIVDRIPGTKETYNV